MSDLLESDLQDLVDGYEDVRIHPIEITESIEYFTTIASTPYSMSEKRIRLAIGAMHRSRSSPA